MVNGPPTPPATTPTELQDEARTNSSIADTSAPPSAPSVPQNIPEIFQTVIPQMAEAIAKNDYEHLVDIAEREDRNTINDRHPSRLLIVAPLVLGHLVLDDLPPARYAIIRLPDNLASFPLSRALMALVTSAMNREHATIYDQAAALNNLVSQPDFMDKDLASAISNLLSAFIEHFRQRTFALLSKAYTSLPLSLASAYLAFPPEQMISVAQGHGWSYDPSAQILSPKADFKPASRNGSLPSSFSSLTTFHFVADSVARLEG
jgi:COP9 signalosome complex subunit 8